MDGAEGVRDHRPMRLPLRTTLLTTLLVAGGPVDRTHDIEDVATAAGLTVHDANTSALYQLRATYAGPPVISSTNRIRFHITRQASASVATAQLDLRLVRGSDTLTGASGVLAPGNTEPNLVALAWTNWCASPPCDVSADLTVELLPGVGDENPPVDLTTVTLTSSVTYETEDATQTGVVDATLTYVP
jgi:hypothetical protein